MAVEEGGAPSGMVSALGRVTWRLGASLILLTAIYTMSFIDRQILSLLIQPIKLSLSLSDTQLGLLQGLAFTLSYVTLSPLFGRLADRYNRRNIIAIGLVAWTACSAACGLVSGYNELLVARLLLGATEACLTPAVWSMLTDMFDERRLPRALSIFLIGPYLGGGLALVFGGVVLETAGRFEGAGLLGGFAPWQITFLLISLPGFLLAGALLLVREPGRRTVRLGHVPNMAEIRRVLWPRRSFYLPFFIGIAALDCILYAVPAWLPTLLIRQFGGTPGVVGSRYGWGVLIAGSLGVLVGPAIARAVEARRGRGDALLIVAAMASVALGLASVPLMLSTSLNGALFSALAMGFLYTVPQALAASALTLATPPRMRGFMTALYILVVTVAGYGVAPLVVGWLAEHAVPPANPLGYSLGLVSLTASIIATIGLFRARRGYVLARAIEQRDSASDDEAPSR